MDEKKPSPIRIRVLLFLGCCALALVLWAFAIGPLCLYLLLPLFRKLCVGEKIALGIWLLLALLAGLLVWLILLYRRGKHRLLAFFGAVYVLFCAFQATPFLDQRVHSPKPELAASFPLEGKGHVPEFYYSGWPYGGSMLSEPSDRLPQAAREKLTELLRDQSRTWIVSYGEEVESITWSFQNVWYYNTMVPWILGLQCDWDWTTSPGDPDTVYIYSIPFAPIDNIY